MSASVERRQDRQTRAALGALAARALSRAAGAPLVEGNDVTLLKDARENYPAWLEAIHSAKHHIHFECYIIHDDDTGLEFAEALTAKARAGVRVRLIYDWMGAFGKTSRRFWRQLRSGGVEVRCYNPPRLDSPLGWLSRDHRKMLAVDGRVGFITGLCVGRVWAGDPIRQMEPWRDTGVEVRGPAVLEIEQAFAQIWALMGEPVPNDECLVDPIPPAGEMSMRVVATLPATAGMIRFDELIATIAQRTLWISDAYYAGTPSYVQALRAAARDGVDVRLLVPNGTDIPLLRPISKAGYRPLLEAGVRVFEWNGPMMHAKTAVADRRWARVGSTNLNIASWMGNCELDAVVEDESFAGQVEEMYLDDLSNVREVVLERRPLRPFGHRRPDRPAVGHGGSAGRAAAGAIRLGNAVGAAFTNHRILEPVEAPLLTGIAILLFVLAAVFAVFPRVLVYPVVVFFVWIAIALLHRSYKLRRERKRGAERS